MPRLKGRGALLEKISHDIIANSKEHQENDEDQPDLLGYFHLLDTDGPP